MNQHFEPKGLPVLVGSLPLSDHTEAADLIWTYTPEIPSWPQLPVFRNERMVHQFLQGLPGLEDNGSRVTVNTEKEAFNEELLQFYEEYLGVTEGSADLLTSRFSLSHKNAGGFFSFQKGIESRISSVDAIKGQITGPVTAGTALKKNNGEILFYDDQLLDAMVKLLSLKARWQTRILARFGRPVMIFIDEPGMAGFGSSEFISISREQVRQSLQAVIEGIRAEGGLAGIHVCANTDWSLILDIPFDIINFDAYAYFDRFILYADQIRRFIQAGGIIAYGIVPTLNVEDIQRESLKSLLVSFKEKMDRIADLGFEPEQIIRQALITPSCGAGALSLDLALKVLNLTRSLSDGLKIR
ncbi:MAG: hypothetical protein AB1659_01035 [Thermodesulfobacteriota bacterium]